MKLAKLEAIEARLAGLRGAPGASPSHPLPPPSPNAPIYVQLPCALQISNVPIALLRAQLNERGFDTDVHGNAQISIRPFLRGRPRGAGEPAAVVRVDSAAHRVEAVTLADRCRVNLLAATAKSARQAVDNQQEHRRLAESVLARTVSRLQTADPPPGPLTTAARHLEGRGTLTEPFVAGSGPIFLQAPVTVAFPGATRIGCSVDRSGRVSVGRTPV